MSTAKNSHGGIILEKGIIQVRLFIFSDKLIKIVLQVFSWHMYMRSLDGAFYQTTKPFNGLN